MLALVWTCLALWASPAAAAVVPDVVDRVEQWAADFAHEGAVPDQETRADLARALDDLREYARLSPGHARAAAGALLELGAAGWRASEEPRRRGLGWALLDRVEVEFDALPEAGIAWVAGEGLNTADARDPARRAMAARLLAARAEDGVTRALVVASRDPDATVALAAGGSLVGRAGTAVDAAFAEWIEASGPLAADDAEAGRRSCAEAHFRRVQLADTDPLQARLEDVVRAGLASGDRRAVAGAASASSALSSARAVPLLLEALDRWSPGGADDPPAAHAVRARFDLIEALERRSGLRLGAAPQRWHQWAAVSGTHIPLPPDQEADSPPTATFFGLEPRSDRVVFVLDRSASMDLPAEDGSGRNRYVCALDELDRALEGIGPTGRFNLVLFHDGADVWSPDPRPCSGAARRAVRAWALRRRPAGGTRLRAGVERAFGLGPDGRAAARAMDADTVVVLCDGRTAEGSRWVLPFLRTENARDRVVVHAVQITATGDGTLEALARETGGTWRSLQASGRR